MNKIYLCGNANEILSRNGLVCLKKVNNNAPQPKRFVTFNTFSHTFVIFKNISMNN